MARTDLVPLRVAIATVCSLFAAAAAIAAGLGFGVVVLAGSSAGVITSFFAAALGGTKADDRARTEAARVDAYRMGVASVARSHT